MISNITIQAKYGYKLTTFPSIIVPFDQQTEFNPKDIIYSRLSILQVCFWIYTTDGNLPNSALLI